MSRILANIIIAFAVATCTLSAPVKLRSRINTEENYRTTSIPSNQIYSISLHRQDSDKAEQLSRCWSVPRSIQVTHREQIFRLSKAGARTRQEKVYEKLTSLSQQQNIIEQFEIVGDKVFVVTTDGLGYFIELSNHQQLHQMQTNLFQNATTTDLDIILKEYKQRVLIITPSRVVLCKFEKTQCDPVLGYQPNSQLRGAELLEENGRFLLFIITKEQILSYELTANGELKDQQKYVSSFFGADKVSFRSIVRDEGASFFILDDIQGVWGMKGRQGLFKGFVPNEKIVFEQFGCFSMISHNDAESITLACNPSLSNFFLMNLAKSTQFTKIAYEPQETIFLQEQIYQVSSVENILMGRVYSGVKLFWSSQQLGNPYPYFYRKAGDVFLHNAIQSKLKIINQVKTIFLAAEDQLLKLEFKSVDPYVSCYSPVGVSQAYKVTYEISCHQQATFLGKENICTKEQYLNFQAWEHKQVTVTSDILPFILSLVGVIAIGCIISKIYKQYNNEVDEARRKYNIQSDELSL